MTEERTVLVVTAGWYSDYKIVGIYDDAALADQAVKKFNNDPDDFNSEARIETWTMNKLFNGQQTVSGYEIEAYLRGREQKWQYVHRQFTTQDISVPTVRVESTSVTVLGRDKEHAERLLLDNIKMIEAKRAGLT